jgi:acyl-coenzyme A synthetase/AMP-(fatty) acid ligase
MSTSALAVVIGKKEIDFDIFQYDIDACTRWLALSLSAEEQRIAVCTHNNYWHWVITLALLRMGRTCASIYAPETTPEDLRSSFVVWIADEPLPEVERAIKPPLKKIRAGAAQLKKLTDENESTVRTSSNNLTLKLSNSAKRVILTSGTTGRPKVISLNAQQLKARLQAASKQFGADVNASTRLQALMGIDTIGGMLTTLVTWLKGGAVLFSATTSNSGNATETSYTEPNLISASPLRLQQLLKRTKGIWPNQDKRIVRVGGSRLNPAVRDAALRRIGSRVQTTYGSTELGLVASCDALLLDQYPGAAGYVYADAKAQIVDRNDNILPHGKTGLIRCQADGMATSYEGEDETNAFRNGWFYAGDIGFLTEDGLLVVTGRDSDVINLGGVKLSAVDLETALLEIEGLQDVCVVGLDDNGTQRLVVAAVHDKSVGLSVLRGKVEQALPAKIPFHLMGLPELPRNAMGKLPRSAIAKKLTEILRAQEKQKNKLDDKEEE